jgi:Zn-dependent peptidase ImmA (M78 family)
MKRYSYQHPGYAFLNQFGSLQSEADVMQYVEFLRQAAGIAEEAMPIDLPPIYQHFCMPEPLRVGLEDQQGILLNSYKGLILIKETDPIVRQRFTEGHELMELLFDAQDDINRDLNLPSWDEARKEQLCDAGAAELLMPRSGFGRRLQALGLSLATARKLAAMYEMSLIATLIRMVELTQEPTALVLWRYALKPTEQRQAAAHTKKLRIWWRKTSTQWQAGFIPKDKSIVDRSIIAQAAATGNAQIGAERLVWGGKAIDCTIEAMPVQINQATCVISLLHQARRGVHPTPSIIAIAHPSIATAPHQIAIANPSITTAPHQKMQYQFHSDCAAASGPIAI